MLKRLSAKMLKCKGFTLIELLTVVFIMVLLTAIILPNYNARSRELALQRSANLLAQSLRKALEKTMSSDEYRDVIPSGGYGIYLSSSAIFLFADCNSDHKYTPGNNRCGLGLPEKIVNETIKLEEGTEILSLSPVSPLNITFQPPDPTVYVNGNPASVDAVVTLSLVSDSSKKRTVVIKRTGLIEVE